MLSADALMTRESLRDLVLRAMSSSGFREIDSQGMNISQRNAPGVGPARCAAGDRMNGCVTAIPRGTGAAGSIGRTAMDGSKKVVVIGSGPGGAGAAAVLAARGHEVDLLERNPFPGGKCASFEKDGYIVDTGVHM